MRHLSLLVAALPLLAMTSHTAPAVASAHGSEVTHELIVVYVGGGETDSVTGYHALIRQMTDSVRFQNATTGRVVVTRGVSLEPLVEDGIRNLALLGKFDEISVGGNWTNSTVLRYLGPEIGSTRHSAIPQVIVLERDVIVKSETSFQATPEREIARFVGIDEITDWIRRGTPNPR